MINKEETEKMEINKKPKSEIDFILPKKSASSIILTTGSRVTMRDAFYRIIFDSVVEVYRKETDETPYIITHLSNLIIYPSDNLE
jgi:hypothetical protein